MGKLYCLNVGFGDASIIISSTATFLIDCHNIDQFSYHLPISKRIRGVFITHQHADHFSGLTYLKHNRYSIDCLIYSPYERRYNDNSVTIEEWNDFNSLKDYFNARGTDLYPAYRQDSFDGPWWETNGVKFHIVGPHRRVADSDTREIHDASLVINATLGHRNCLFAGDASDTSLEHIVGTTTNYCNDILHASHHGSLNGAHLPFIKESNANTTFISTKSGVHPSVPHPTALERYRTYTDQVFRSDTDGTKIWNF